VEETMTKPLPQVVLILFTTLYRDGGMELARAAATMAREKRAQHAPNVEIRSERIESKAELLAALARLADDGKQILELHFFGHSGMYGPMYRTTAMPEQMSPHEWRSLRIAFAPLGQAWFHACRTARWFTPFFARTFGVPAYGYHWYTTFSLHRERFVWPGLERMPGRPHAVDAPLYLMGCRGKKSDGLAGSVLKYAGLLPPETMQRFLPQPVAGDATYDGVAELYDAVFADIRVRKPEWQWLSAHLPARPGLRILDIGCGNGALLQALLPRLGVTGSGIGVDASAGMIRQAELRNQSPQLAFHVIDGPILPLPDQSVDVVTSLLSFRYLDWDPIMNEIRRVLAPGGRLLIVDMVTVPVAPRELPRAALDMVRARRERLANPSYTQALKRLVEDPRWANMLTYNPIRAQHEYVWYLESRFPGQKVTTLDIGWHNRVLAFDTGPLEPGTVAPQSYP
jgi:ubiquinone/menaquinone biosynthesis C-methylase UbiE